MAYRVDAGTTRAKVERTPQGGIRVDAVLTRTGVLRYRNPDGSTRFELRTPDEVFRADALAALRGATLTRGHPSDAVSTTSFKRVVIGHVGDDVRQDGTEVVASVVINDADAIRDVESGVREMSCGYHVDLDPVPGVFEGQRYDAVQRNIRYNHVALVERGRAGARVSLRLDAAEESRRMLIMGREFDVQSPTFEADARAHMAEVEAANKARTDALEAELVPHRKAARVALETQAKKLAGREFKCDGLTDHEVRATAVGEAAIGKSEEYVRAMFDLRTEGKAEPRKDDCSSEPAHAALVKKPSAEKHEREVPRHERPLAVSRR